MGEKKYQSRAVTSTSQEICVEPSPLNRALVFWLPLIAFKAIRHLWLLKPHTCLQANVTLRSEITTLPPSPLPHRPTPSARTPIQERVLLPQGPRLFSFGFSSVTQDPTFSALTVTLNLTCCLKVAMATSVNLLKALSVRG